MAQTGLTTTETLNRAVVGKILLGLTLLTALCLSVARIVGKDRLNWWWVRVLAGWGVSYRWEIPLTMVVLVVGLGLSALVIRRSPRRVWGVAVCLALLVVSYRLPGIVGELEVSAGRAMNIVARLSTGLMTMSAAGAWLLATRRNPVAALASLAGVGLGVGVTYIMDALWGLVDVNLGPGPRGWAALPEAYFWLIVLAVAITVWLGALLDKAIGAQPAGPPLDPAAR